VAQFLRTVTSIVASIVFSIGNASAAAHEQVLYTFDAVPHGGTPAARLIADTEGNLYGTTFNGGALLQSLVCRSLRISCMVNSRCSNLASGLERFNQNHAFSDSRRSHPLGHFHPLLRPS
jgi:hypothetical protein